MPTPRHAASRIVSAPAVCEVEQFAWRLEDGSDGAANLLIEVPHGATRKAHFDAVRNRLSSPLPDDLLDFFYVNTDVGSFECATNVARLLAERTENGFPPRVLVLRSLIPRTFIDCNRIVGKAESHARLTPAMPEYISAERDRELLEQLHGSYQETARLAYERVCGSGGLALQLHTYAPRSVRIERIDGNIVEALHHAYEPGNYENWEQRPDVEVISAADDGEQLAASSWVESIRSHFEDADIVVEQNATYRLHPSTTGYSHAASYRGQVLCLEINRALLADPFSPFQQMHIGPSNVAAVSAPIAAACAEELNRRRGD